ncbi:hypothetical protein FH972_005960 [Carpinus fangiana]|uniref:Uncharacterized protein n=1 Tax=Carpinus fangiana TaxID=176857 RepID=A0A5N6QSP8_9ROSI|nr:hypothetical protein FH972_005960 [Carpinus fangiana]
MNLCLISLPVAALNCGRMAIRFNVMFIYGYGRYLLKLVAEPSPESLKTSPDCLCSLQYNPSYRTISAIAILGSLDLVFNVNDLDSALSYQPKADPSSNRGSTNLPQPRYRVCTPIGSPTPPQPTHTRVPIHRSLQVCRVCHVRRPCLIAESASSRGSLTMPHRRASPRPWASYLAILGSPSLPSSPSLSTLPSRHQARRVSHRSLG